MHSVQVAPWRAARRSGLSRSVHTAARRVIDQLEPRRLLATLNGTPNADIITVDISGVNIVITLNGTPNNFLDATNADIIVNGGGGNDIITVIRNGANPTTINGGDGNDTISVGGGVYEGLILSSVAVRGDADIDTVILNDSSAPSGDTYTVSGSILTRSGAAITTAFTTENMELRTSSLDDVVNVIETVNNRTYAVSAGAGDDQIVIASSVGFRDLGLFINGNIALNAGSGVDTVIYNDQDNTTADTYTLDAPTFTTSAMGGVAITFGSAIDVQIINASVGAFAQTFNLLSNSFNGVSVNAGDGNDTINIAEGDYDVVFEDVSVNGGGGTDRIVINSSTESSTEGWQLTSTQLSRNVSVDSIVPTEVEQLTLNAGTGGELFSIAGMPPGLAVTINAGDGDDTLDASTIDDIDNTVTGNLRFVGGAGDDLIDATDTADSLEVTPENYAVGSGSLQKSSATFGSLTHSTVERLLLIADGDNSTIELGSIGTGQSFTLNGGAGNDTFVNNQSLLEIADLWSGNATLNGGAGIDSILFDDSGENDANVETNMQITLSAMTFTTTNGQTAQIVYSSVNRIEYTGNSSGATFEINSIGSIPVSINGGGGNDTLNVGTGNLDNNALGVNLLTVAGGTGTDSIVFNDSNDTAVVGESEEYDITYSLIGTGVLSKGLLVSVQMSGLERMRIDGSIAPSVYDIGQLNIATTINAGVGDDSVDVSDGNYNGFNIVGAGTLVINGGGGNDTVEIDDSGEAINDSYLLTNNAFGVNAIATLSYFNVESIDFNAGTGDNIITIAGTAAGSTYIVSGNAGSDTFNVGTASGSVDAILGTLSLLGGSGTDTLSYNDQANTTAHSYAMFLGRTITRTGAASVGFSNLVEHVVLRTGTQADVIDIRGVSSTIVDGVVVAAGDGDDTVTFGGGDFDSNIFNTLTLNAGNGIDSLVLDDRNDNDPGDTYNLDGIVLSKSSTTVVAGAGFFEHRRFDLAAGNERFQILSTGEITVNGGLGDDTVANLTGDLDDYPERLLFDGQGGTDSLLLDHVAQPAGTGDIVRFQRTSATVGRVVSISAIPEDVVDYTNVEALVLTDGLHDLRVEITGTIQGTILTLNLGNGNDTVDIGDGPNIVDDVDGNVIVNGQGGNDSLFFDDAGGVGSKTWTLESAFVAATGMANTTYNTIETLVINAGSGNDTLNIEGTVALVNYQVNASGGADIFHVGDTNNDIDANILGSILMNGGDGADQLFYNDFGDTPDPDTYNFGAGASESFSKTGSGNMNALFIERRSLIANNGNNTIFVDNALPGLSIDARDGNDVINVLDATGVVTIGSGQGLDTLNVDADNDANEAAVTFFGSEDLQTLSIGAGSVVDVPGSQTLVIFGSIGGGWSGTLDLNSGYLINRAGGTPIGTWALGLTVGFNGGAWNGTGISSSVAAASVRSDGIGYRLAGEPGLVPLNEFGNLVSGLDPNDVLLSYTLNGDVDLDRDVDFADLLRLAQNYDPTIGGRNWSQGNFNYNTADNIIGAVGFPDLLGQAQNYLQPLLTAGRPELVSTKRIFSEIDISV